MSSKKEETKKQTSISRIVKEVLILSGSKYLVAVITCIRGFIIVGFFSPAVYGLWHILKMLISNAKYFGLGTTDAMRREVPLNQGKQQEHVNSELKRTSLTWGLLIVTLIAGVIFLATLSPLITQYQLEIQLTPGPQPDAWF